MHHASHPASGDAGPSPHACCAGQALPESAAPLKPAASQAIAHPHAGGHAGHAAAASHTGLTTSATLHCLSGCAIGELAGLMIGVTLGLNPWATMALATALGFLSGYALGLRPLVQQGMSIRQAFKTIWLGETVSIAAMEFAMNFTDYHVGGVTAASIFVPQFWLGYAAALPAGFVFAWPVNWWLLRKNIKQQCH